MSDISQVCRRCSHYAKLDVGQTKEALPGLLSSQRYMWKDNWMWG